jgi:hypothetical protein
METLFSYQLQLLLIEIEIIQSKISSFDDLSFKIKGWAVTLWSAIIIWSYKNGGSDLLLIAVIVILSFWFLDAYYKTIQIQFRTRMSSIEDFINSKNLYEDNNLVSTFQRKTFETIMIFDPIGRLGKKFNVDYKKNYYSKTNIWKAFFIWDVTLLYLILLSVTLFILYSTNVVEKVPS